MKPKTLILMVVAVVCGLGASYMTSRLLAERDDKPAEAPPEEVKLLVAKKALNMHTPFRGKPEDYFVEKKYLKDNAPEGALTIADLPKLKGKFLKRALSKDIPVTQNDILETNPTLASLPAGMRAVGIQLSAEQQASGFACVPGSHVDVQWTRTGGNDKDTFTKVLLRDVIVLAADVQDQQPDGAKAVLANVVTLALSEEDSMKITLAKTKGTLCLVLRNLDDNKNSDVDIITMDILLKSKVENKDPVPPVVPDATPVAPVPDLKRDFGDRGGREPKIDDRKVDPEQTRPQPPKLTKKTIVIRNNQDVQVRHYWVDENDNIITNPQQYLDQWEQNGAPPGPGPQDDSKPKVLPKNV
jgi:Flp pilus assembly protein CpaB